MTGEVRREVVRKLLHMSMGFFALGLRWLAPWQAALCAIAALAHNLWLFPHYGMKKLERPEEKASGYSGMVGYPAVVFVLLLLSWWPILPARFAPPDEGLLRLRLAHVAGAWAVLAFGDAGAALCGIFLKGPALPWNPKKRWTGLAGFTLIGGTLASLWWHFVAYGFSPSPHLGQEVVTAFVAAFLAGIVETMPGQIDDNLTVPLAGWVVISFFNGQGWAFLASSVESQRIALMFGLLAANALMGLAALRLKWVGKASCAVGILFGSVVVLGCGWKGYGLLLTFYLISQLSTFYGKKVKAHRGIAEPHEGRRDVGSVFSKGLVPAFFSLVSPLAFAASLAVYAADTVASEVGKASRGPARLLFRRKRVEQGNVGAISMAGTLAGLAAILFFVAVASAVGLSGDGRFFLADDERVFGGGGSFTSVGAIDLAVLLFSFFIACVVAFFSESLMNEKIVARGLLSKELGHLFLGGLAGSLVFGIASLLVALLSQVT